MLLAITGCSKNPAGPSQAGSHKSGPVGYSIEAAGNTVTGNTTVAYAFTFDSGTQGWGVKAPVTLLQTPSVVGDFAKNSIVLSYPFSNTPTATMGIAYNPNFKSVLNGNLTAVKTLTAWVAVEGNSLGGSGNSLTAISIQPYYYNYYNRRYTKNYLNKINYYPGIFIGQNFSWSFGNVRRDDVVELGFEVKNLNPSIPVPPFLTYRMDDVTFWKINL
jgi:hypothetical protein